MSLSRQAKISAERDLKGRRVKNFSRVSTFPSQQKAEGTVLFFSLLLEAEIQNEK